MDHDEALAFWFGRIDYERRTVRRGNLKLDRIRQLLAYLGNPHQRLRIIHITGSKGKGSTAAMLAQVLQAAGYRTGLFTSPHLVHVEERVQVDGVPISRAELVARLTQIRPVVERMDRPGDPHAAPTFFEIGTALGFLHFLYRRVDFAVVEVGLGGRFDSTNVCLPLVSIITSISYDHMHILGNTLAQIAYEKAGIVKPGRPTVSGCQVPEPAEVIARVCREQGSRLLVLGRDFTYAYQPGRIDAQQTRLPTVHVRTRQRDWGRLELGLHGQHQAANAALVVATVELLIQQGVAISPQAVRAGLRQVRWPARFEVVGHAPWVVLDCAHNVAAVQALMQTLLETFPQVRQRHLLFAVSSDKDVPGIVVVLAPHFASVCVTRFLDNPRAVDPQALAEQFRAHAPDLPCTVAPDPASALAEVRQRATTADDLICVTGSVFLVGEVRVLLDRPASTV